MQQLPGCLGLKSAKRELKAKLWALWRERIGKGTGLPVSLAKSVPPWDFKLRSALVCVGLWLTLLQHVVQVPVDAEADPLVGLLGPVNEMPVLETVLKQIPCDFHIVTAIVGQFLHLTLLEPF
jgi:hypothetical protein